MRLVLQGDAGAGGGGAQPLVGPPQLEQGDDLVRQGAQGLALGVVEGELSFMGLGEYFQIWKLESFEADVDEPLDEWLDEMGEDFDPMSLVP